MKGMKQVLLISFSERGSLGVRLLSSILRKEYQVSILSFKDIGSLDDRASRMESIPAIVDFCKDYEYILMGVITFTAHIAFQLADAIRARYPQKVVIMGGGLAMVRPYLCLEHADYVCLFEGEGILELLHALDGQERPQRVGNFICDTREVETEISAPPVLDSLPMPDYSNPSEFLVDGVHIREGRMLPPEILVQTMRGCPYGCAFCFNTAVNRLKRKHGIPLVRFRSMKNVIPEMSYIQTRVPGLESFHLTADDNFLAHGVEELTLFASEYDRRIAIPLKVVIDLRTPQFHEKIRCISRMRSLVHVSFGIESGSEEFNRHVYNRAQANAEALEKYVFMKSTFDKRVELVGELMYCHPVESKDDVLQTLDLMLKMKGARFSICHFLPLPGTPLAPEDSDFPSQSQSDINLQLFNRYPLYYFLMFLIKHQRKYYLDFLLPHSIHVNWLTEFLNRPFFSGFYTTIIRLSTWHGELRIYRKSPVEMLGSLWRAIFPVNGWGASSGDSAAHI